MKHLLVALLLITGLVMIYSGKGLALYASAPPGQHDSGDASPGDEPDKVVSQDAQSEETLGVSDSAGQVAAASDELVADDGNVQAIIVGVASLLGFMGLLSYLEIIPLGQLFGRD